MLYLYLANKTKIEVKEGSTLFDISVSPEQYQTMWASLTVDNLKVVQLVDEDNNIIDQLSDLVVDSESSVKIKDAVECHFYLREKSELELLREEVTTLRETYDVHDGAITDLAVAVSTLADGGL